MNPPQIIFLIGFSTTGKSQVARLVAQHLGWGYFDTDEEIVRQAGKSIAEIFSQDGEAHFRILERQALLAASQKEGIVIATGGGIVLDPQNRQWMLKQSMVVCLEAEPATIYERLLRDTQDTTSPNIRPLLAVPDPLQRIQELKAQRQPYYAIAHHTIPTDNLSLEAVAAEVIRAWQRWSKQEEAVLAPAVEVKTPTTQYPIYVGWTCLDRLAQLMRQARLNGRAMLISDETVLERYGERVLAALRTEGFAPCVLAMPPGENTKSLENAARVYDFLVEHRVEREDTIVALGGGVVGDLAGFVAATFLRGIPWVAVPTTLMAMVDASIGGKVAVNHPRAKNFIGAFYHPHLVLSDAQTLTSLPPRELASGWSEVIKHGIILDARLFSDMEAQAEALLSLEPQITVDIISRSAQAKAKVVGEDERETTGRRQVLNYGHTVGHALEAATGYQRFFHGEAVAIGMVAAGQLSQRLGLVATQVAERQERLLKRFGLPTSTTGVELEAVLQAMELDKKTRQGAIHWVLLRDIGQVVILHRVPQVEVNAVLEGLLAHE